MYTWFYHAILARTDAEWAHRFGVWSFRYGGWLFALAKTLRIIPGMPEDASVTAMGIRFPGRVGLAAGMDKDGQAIRGLVASGFAFVEVGTVTPRPQPGNAKPRSWRELDVHGLRNAMGFNNAGADALARRLATLRKSRGGADLVVGVNIGKNKTTEPEQAPGDYAYSARLLAPYADYLVVNVSSPNTPGLRDLQSAAALRPILERVRHAAHEASPERRVPLLVKIAPDLADADVDDVVDIALNVGLDGIVATNTTIAHDLGPGGLSGPPVHARAVEVVKRVHDRAGDRLTVVGVGGVSSLTDAQHFIDAGATVVQVYTGFVYRGPRWVARLNRELA